LKKNVESVKKQINSLPEIKNSEKEEKELNEKTRAEYLYFRKLGNKLKATLNQTKYKHNISTRSES
jgi:nitrogenase molybdenum-iron protein alpha/beta subunit